MKRRLSINPVTRANGVLSLEVDLEDHAVVDARSIGPIFRGFEVLLKGRDPRDAPYFTERVCGICSAAHGIAACLALENAAGVTIPPNGQLVRNLVLGADFLQSHIRHFYLLALPDYFAGPDVPPFRPRSFQDLRFGREAELRLTEHYVQAIAASRRAHQVVGMLGGKAPFPHSLVPGGASISPTAHLVTEVRSVLREVRGFIEGIYLDDLELLKVTYPDYFELGTGPLDLLVFRLFPLLPGGALWDSGAVLDGRPEAVVEAEIAEDVTRAFFAQAAGGHPSQGHTYPDPGKENSYTWVKAPRYRGRAMECGPLARAWLSGDRTRGPSVMARLEARAREALQVARAMEDWLDQLVPGDPVTLPITVPRNASASGLAGAQRGALGHWMRIEGGRIASYQIITPSAWNFSPRDSQGQPGPVERALMGTRVENPEEPVELGRIVRSFDPCVSCAVHVTRAGGQAQVLKL
ncbi:MAG: nickel-dependent hydrogenase large subunit [Bacillota bacterium]